MICHELIDVVKHIRIAGPIQNWSTLVSEQMMGTVTKHIKPGGVKYYQTVLKKQVQQELNTIEDFYFDDCKNNQKHRFDQSKPKEADNLKWRINYNLVVLPALSTPTSHVNEDDGFYYDPYPTGNTQNRNLVESMDVQLFFNKSSSRISSFFRSILGCIEDQLHQNSVTSTAAVGAEVAFKGSVFLRMCLYYRLMQKTTRNSNEEETQYPKKSSNNKNIFPNNLFSFLRELQKEINSYVHSNGKLVGNILQVLLANTVATDPDLLSFEDIRTSIETNGTFYECDFNLQVIENILHFKVIYQREYVIKGHKFSGTDKRASDSFPILLDQHNWANYVSSWCCFRSSTAPEDTSRSFGLVNYFLKLHCPGDPYLHGLEMASITRFDALITYYHAKLNSYNHRFSNIPLVNLRQKCNSNSDSQWISNEFVLTSSMYCSPIGVIGAAGLNDSKGDRQLYAPYIPTVSKIIGKGPKVNVHYITDSDKVEVLLLTILRPQWMEL
jgi:hypothetical protein